MEKKRLLIIGAGGHGRVVADVAQATARYADICFFDDADPSDLKVQVAGRVADIRSWSKDAEVFVAIGSNQTRQKLQEWVRECGFQLATLIHPSAVISENVVIAAGTVVMPNAVINNGAKIGTGVIINTAATIDHDCVIGDYCHISPGVHIAGTVNVGNRTWIGVGASVVNNVSICGDCVIGAGAVVVKDISTEGVYKGVPVKMRTNILGGVELISSSIFTAVFTSVEVAA